MMNSIQSFASVTLPKTLILLTLLFKLVANQSLSFAVLTSFEHSTLGDNCSAVLQKATNKLKNASLLSSNVSLSCSVIKTEVSYHLKILTAACKLQYVLCSVIVWMY